MQARMYDPEIGRFLSVDPLSDLFPEQSPYAYGHNNPIRFLDPDGRCPKGYQKGDIWNNSVCGPEVPIIADRIGGSGFASGDGQILFDASSSEGREGLFNHFYNHPGQISSFVSNNDFSLEARHIALKASRAIANKKFGIYTYHITAQSLSIASLATGAGAIGLGVRGLSTIGARALSNQMGNLSLSISSAELGLRTAGYVSGNDSFGNLAATAIGFGGSRILSSPMIRGVSFNSTTGPVFRSSSTGRYVTNNYGTFRYGVSTTGQIGIMSIPFIY